MPGLSLQVRAWLESTAPRLLGMRMPGDPGKMPIRSPRSGVRMVVVMMTVMVVVGVMLRRGGNRTGEQKREYQESLHALLGCS